MFTARKVALDMEEERYKKFMVSKDQILKEIRAKSKVLMQKELKKEGKLNVWSRLILSHIVYAALLQQIKSFIRYKKLMRAIKRSTLKFQCLWKVRKEKTHFAWLHRQQIKYTCSAITLVTEATNASKASDLVYRCLLARWSYHQFSVKAAKTIEQVELLQRFIKVRNHYR